MSAKIKMICRVCKGKNVLCLAYAEWNFKKQRWDVVEKQDVGDICIDCGASTSIDEVPAESPDQRAASDMLAALKAALDRLDDDGEIIAEWQGDEALVSQMRAAVAQAEGRS